MLLGLKLSKFSISLINFRILGLSLTSWFKLSDAWRKLHNLKLVLKRALEGTIRLTTPYYSGDRQFVTPLLRTGHITNHLPSTTGFAGYPLPLAGAKPRR